jgi:AcrR family transcriptional regulator
VRALPGHSTRSANLQLPPSREEAVAAQRDRILRTTAELVSKRGYNATSTELIVRRARVGYGTFYKYFSDKEECMLALIEEAEARAAKAMEDACARTEGEWPRRTASALAALFESIAADRHLAKACLVESLNAGPRAQKRYRAAVSRLADLLRPGRDFAPDADDLPSTVEDTLAGGVLWIAYERLIVGDHERLRTLIPEMVEFALTPFVGEARAVAIAEDVGAEASVG